MDLDWIMAQLQFGRNAMICAMSQTEGEDHVIVTYLILDLTVIYYN